MKRLSKNRVIAIVVLVVVAICARMVCNFAKPVLNSTGDPGAKLFPFLGLGLMTIGSIGLLIQKEAQTEPFMSREEIIRLLKLAAGFILYAAGLWALGFLIATPIMLFTVMGLMAGEKKLSLVIRLVYSIAIAAILYAVFTNVLKFKLPSGILPFSLF